MATDPILYTIEDLSKLPALIYFQGVVDAVADLYVAFPNGGEYGFYALVNTLGKFARWNQLTDAWEVMGKDYIIVGTYVDSVTFQVNNMNVLLEENVIYINNSVKKENYIYINGALELSSSLTNQGYKSTLPLISITTLPSTANQDDRAYKATEKKIYVYDASQSQWIAETYPTDYLYTYNNIIYYWNSSNGLNLCGVTDGALNIINQEIQDRQSDILDLQTQINNLQSIVYEKTYDTYALMIADTNLPPQTDAGIPTNLLKGQVVVVKSDVNHSNTATTYRYKGVVSGVNVWEFIQVIGDLSTITTQLSDLTAKELALENNKLSITDTFTNLATTYKHSRTSEMNGDNTYNSRGLGYYKKFTTDKILTRVGFMCKSTDLASASAYINVYTTDAISTGQNPTTSYTLVESFTQVLDTTMKERVVILSNALTLPAGKYIVVLVSLKSANMVSMPRWSTNEYNDRDLLLTCTSTDYANIFNVNWLIGSSGYWQSSIKLYCDIPYNEIKDKLSISTAVSGSKSVYVSTHGDSEYIGTNNYLSVGGGYTYLAKEDRVFNCISLMGSVETPIAVYIKVFKSSTIPNDTNLSALTLLGETSQIWDTSMKLRDILFDNSMKLLSGEYLIIVFSTKSSTKVNTRYFTTNPNSDRGYGVFSNITSDYENIFTSGKWYKFSGSYYQTDIKLSIVIPYVKSTTSQLEIVLPDKITAIVGDKLQIFYRSLIKSVNPYNYNILITCSKGNQYPRYFEFTPVLADVGAYTFNITLKDSFGNIVSSKTCQLIVKNTVQSPASVKKILCVGDSLTSYGEWCVESSRRLIGTGGTPAGLGLSNIALIGRKTSGNVGWEGTGGWSWSSFATAGVAAYRFYVSGITTAPAIGAVYTNNGGTFTIAEVNITNGSGNIRCTSVGTPTASGTLTKSSGTGDVAITFSSSAADAGNPFWNNGTSQLDFTSYVNTYMGGQCDAIYILLTWNGISAWQTDFASMITTAKTLIDHIHTNYPNCKIKIMGLQVPSINGGMGANYGATGTGYADQYGMLNTAFNMNKAYQSWCNETAYATFMEYVDVASQFDSENNMQESDTSVNSRSSKTEKRGTNGVHPATEGYYQIADVVFRNVVKEFCQ